MKCCVTVILSVLLARPSAAHSDTVVQIQEGTLRGTTLTSPRSNRTFFAFMGIPYAKPPVQNLRFMAPQLPASWDGKRDAVVEGSVCPQKNPYTFVYEGDEDCLFLNVYTPQLPSKAGQSLKAVMVWIHGGGWHFSSGNRDVNGPEYFMDEDVILVTINYRLGALGFLSFPTANITGNNGLKDQVMALRWVRQNIAQFGGDPDNVTIFGASAGGASVHYHMLSSMSQGLFHRAISQSGSALNAWAFNEPETNHNFSYGLAELLGHNYTDFNELIEHLREETPERIVDFTFTLGAQGRGIPFHPTSESSAYDGEIFLPDTPGRLITEGRLHKVPYIAGINSREGIWEVTGIRKAVAENSVHLEDIPAELGIEMDGTGTTEAAAEIRRLYFGNKSASQANVDQHIELSGDLFIVAGVYLAARKLSLLSTTPVYFYEFSYSGGMSIFKSLVGGDEIAGSCHLDETAYLFRFARLNKTFGSETSEWKTSRRILRLWTNFAKTGNPTQEPDPLLQNVVWAPVTHSDFRYLSIGTDLALRHNFNKDRMDFWEALLQYNNTDT